MKIIETAKKNESWQLAMYCAAIAAGIGCRSWEIKNLQLQDISIADSKILVRREIAKNRQEREPRLMALAEWGLRELLYRARTLGATEPEHYLLPMNLRKSRHWSKKTKQKWDVTQPMITWVKSWRKLMTACRMPGFRFHDLRHTFRTQGAEAGVPLEDRDGGESRFPPQRIGRREPGLTTLPLRMYTEEEVAAILQVSLSQLRKWRMRQYAGRQQGPPFKKVGRLVRYPQRALQTYIDGD